MEESLFRKNSMEQMAGFLVWASFANSDSYVTGTAQVENGSMVIIFDDPNMANKVEVGMTAVVGDTESTITSIGNSYDGSIFAVADTSLADGSYSTRVVFRQTQVIKLLFH